MIIDLYLSYNSSWVSSLETDVQRLLLISVP
jgi:hypothetical protein